jgi:hypothetical protein
MDTTTLGVIKALHNQFVEAHGDIHTVYVAAHEREHEQALAASEAALDLAARRLAEVERAIREHFDTILTERDNRYEERFAASQVAVQAALAEREKAVGAAFVAAEKAIEAAFEASKEAIVKSETSVIKQADSTFVKIDKMQEALTSTMPKDEVLSRFTALAEAIAEMRKTQENNQRDTWDRLKTLEAVSQGKAESQIDMRGWIVAVIAVASLAVTVAVAFAGRA